MGNFNAEMELHYLVTRLLSRMAPGTFSASYESLEEQFKQCSHSNRIVEHWDNAIRTRSTTKPSQDT